MNMRKSLQLDTRDVKGEVEGAIKFVRQRNRDKKETLTQELSNRTPS